MAAAERTGRCLCGKVRLTAVLDEAAGVHACHCGMCRRWFGGVGLLFDARAVAFDPDAPVRTFASSAWGERLFCAACGSNLGWRMRDGSYQSLAAYLFEGTGEAPLATEIFIDDKPAGYAFAGDTKRLTAAEVAEMIGKLDK